MGARLILAALLACVGGGVAGGLAPPPQEDPVSSAFWAHWGDGKAEIASYDLVQPRYGEPRAGTAVLIFVTEDFSWSERVKADPGQHPERDIRKVMKLNHTRDFQTGIYPYHVMTSVFARLDGRDGMDVWDPIKITFSAQEWCGMVYDELTMGPRAAHVTGHTYFDADTRPPATHAVPEDVLYGDALPIVLRGLDGAWLAPGESRRVPYWAPQMEWRFAHVPPKVGAATVSRAAEPVEKAVPAGAFRVDAYTVAVEGGATTTWYVEAAAPHRIVAWSSTTGEAAELRGSDRLPYWQLNKPGDEIERARVGL